MHANAHAAPFKAFPIGGDASLTLSAEARLRSDTFDTDITIGNHYQQHLFRGVFCGHLRFDSHVRVYAMVATGPVEGR